jgi:hypothetical protein
LVAQNSGVKKKFNVQNATAGISNGYEQAQGHDLGAHMLTNKLLIALNSGEKNKINIQDTTARIYSGCEQAQGHEL